MGHAPRAILSTHQQNWGLACGDRLGLIARAVSYRTNTVGLMADEFNHRSHNHHPDRPVANHWRSNVGERAVIGQSAGRRNLANR